MIDRSEGPDTPMGAAKEMVRMLVEEGEDWAVTMHPNKGFLVMVHLHLVEMGYRSVLDPFDAMVCVIRSGGELPDHLQELMEEWYRQVQDGDDQED